MPHKTIMNYLTWKRKWKNSDGSIVGIIIISIVLLFEKISQSPIIILYIIWFLVWVVLIYFVVQRLKKRDMERPASLSSEHLKKYPIVIEYMPPKWIWPAEAWLLYNCRVDPTDLTCLIYQRTLDWLISIDNILWNNSKKIEKIKLKKLKNIPNSRPFFEREIFNSIFFKMDTREVTYSFQLKYAFLLEDLEIYGIEKWWIDKPSFWVRWKTIYALIILLFPIFLLAFFFMPKSSLREYFVRIMLFVLLILISILVWWYLFGWKKLKLTDEWAKLASHLIGYRNFIKSCDENKIKLLLKEDPLFVDKVIPYATAFWIETEFIKKITPMKKDFYGKSSWLSTKNGNLSNLVLYILMD